MKKFILSRISSTLLMRYNSKTVSCLLESITFFMILFIRYLFIREDIVKKIVVFYILLFKLS